MPQHSCLPVFARKLDGARLMLPAAARGGFGDRAALSPSPAGCVLLLAPEVWDTMLPLLQACSAHNQHAAQLYRLLAAGETSAPLDRRGRLCIPRLHLAWAGLRPGGCAVLVILGQAVEVWETTRLDARLEQANRRLRELDVGILREQLPLFEGQGG